MNCSTHSHPDLVPWTTNLEAASSISYESSFETERSDTQGNILIPASEVRLIDGHARQPPTWQLQFKARRLSNSDVVMSKTLAVRTKTLIAADVESAVQELVAD